MGWGLKISGSMGGPGQKGKIMEALECNGGIKSNESRAVLGQIGFRRGQFEKFKWTRGHGDIGDT